MLWSHGTGLGRTAAEASSAVMTTIEGIPLAIAARRAAERLSPRASCTRSSTARPNSASCGVLVEQEAVLSRALAADLGKSPIEAYATEIGFTINEIDQPSKHAPLVDAAAQGAAAAAPPARIGADRAASHSASC